MNIQDIRLTDKEIIKALEHLLLDPSDYIVELAESANAATDKAIKKMIEWLECRNVFTGNGRIEFEMKESDFIALKSKE